MKMNDEKKETSIKFQNKNEIINAISVLTPLVMLYKDGSDNYKFAYDKILDLTKLL